MADHKDNKPTPERERVSPLFMATIIIIATAILAFGFISRIAYFRSLDPTTKSQHITPKQFREMGGLSERLTVGLTIERFQNFDITKNNFEFLGNLWFQFEAGTISLETLREFSFFRANLNYVSKPEVRMINDKFFVRYIIKVSFNAGFNYSDFPFDDHRVYLVLTHPYLSPDEFMFDSSMANFVIMEDLQPFGWNMVGSSVSTGYIEASLNQTSSTLSIKQPIAVFAIDIERYGTRNALSILLPIYLLYILMYFAFCTDENSAIALVLGGVSGMLAYRYIIEQLSPVFADLMLSDRFFFLFLASGIMIFILQMFDAFFVKPSIRVKQIVTTSILICTVAIAAILFKP